MGSSRFDVLDSGGACDAPPTCVLSSALFIHRSTAVSTSPPDISRNCCAASGLASVTAMNMEMFSSAIFALADGGEEVE